MNLKSRMRGLTRTKLFSLVILLFALIVIFTAATDGYMLNFRNIRSILQSITVVSMLAIGCGLMLIGGNVDLSLGGVGTMGAMILAATLRAGLPWFIALIIALICCAAAGAVNCFMVSKLRFPAFIATMAMASVAQGVAFIISSGQQIDITDPVIGFIGTQRIFNFVPCSVLIAVVALIVYGLILKKTKFGRQIYLVGGNREASRLVGIKPMKVYYTLFINASCLACLGGALLAARLKTSTTEGISAQQFTGITAAILGGISFGGGSGGMGGCLVGILILNVFDNGLAIMGVPTYWQTVASGLLLLVALVYDYFASKRSK